MLSGPRWACHRDRTVLVSHPKGWRINDRLFYLLPSVDDNALVELARLRRFRYSVDLIAPPWAAQVLRTAVHAVLPRDCVEVYAIGDYIECASS